jgi:DNA-binding HxlR family transcriptional regulator
MQRTDFNEMFCPAARALACVGEWWSLLILRDAFQGLRRFDAFKESLGISTNILARRLGHLTREGILERRPYQQRPLRYEYFLTAKGREFFPLLLFLYRWGNRYQANEGIAVELADSRSGIVFDPVAIDRRSGAEILPEDVMLKTAPGAPPAVIARAKLMEEQRAAAGAGTSPRGNRRSAKPRHPARNGSNKKKRASS